MFIDSRSTTSQRSNIIITQYTEKISTIENPKTKFTSACIAILVQDVYKHVGSVKLISPYMIKLKSF